MLILSLNKPRSVNCKPFGVNALTKAHVHPFTTFTPGLLVEIKNGSHDQSLHDCAFSFSFS